jgi:hypothetical protein
MIVLQENKLTIRYEGTLYYSELSQEDLLLVKLMIVNERSIQDIFEEIFKSRFYDTRS